MKKAFASVALTLALSSSAVAGGKYKFDLKAPTSAKKDAKTTTTLHFHGTAPYHVNVDYPVKLTITAPSGVKVEKATQTQKDAVKFEKEGADFAVEFTPSETGKKSFTGEMKFAVCTATECAPSYEKIAFDVDVN